MEESDLHAASYKRAVLRCFSGLGHGGGWHTAALQANDKICGFELRSNYEIPAEHVYATHYLVVTFSGIPVRSQHR